MPFIHPAIPQQNVLGTVFECTPDLADRLLDDDTEDALISLSVVDPSPDIRQLGRSIREGSWNALEMQVTFSPENAVVGGRGILHAISALGVSMPVLGVQAKAPAGEAMSEPAGRLADEPRRERRLDDRAAAGAAMRKNRHVVLAVARKIIQWEAGDYSFETKKAEEKDCDRLVGSRPEITASVDVGVSVHGRSNQLISGSVAGFCHYYMAQLDRDLADWFLDRVADGANLNPQHPVLTLRRALMADRRADARPRDDQRVAYVFRAWNAVRDGRPLTRLQHSPGDPMPKPR